MAQNGTPAGEEQLILALAAGATVREAAEQAGVDERIAHRRLADADFRRAVSEARGRLFDAARGRLASLAGKGRRDLGAADGKRPIKSPGAYCSKSGVGCLWPA
jgi:hypothetical protein